MTTVQQNPEPSGQALPAGTRIEEFVIERVLGSGGFGITYLARDARLNRQVVIKENLPVQFCFRDTHSLTVAPRHSQGEDAENFKWSLENFSKEAAMLASLDHPGIVKVLRSFEAFGTAYFVMPFVEGLALDELSKQRDGTSFSEEELCGLLERMLAALGYLHDRGIYHRDIKPGNILITNDGIPVLIDFGSARQRLSERSMTVVESAGYTPFEQLQSRGNVGPWSDLYALGGTLVKVITGETPPKAMDRMRKDPFLPLAERAEMASCFSPGFLQSLDQALAVDEDDRWQEAGEWRAALRAGLNKQADAEGVRSLRAVMPNEQGPTIPPSSEAQPDPAVVAKKEETNLWWGVVALIVLGMFAVAKSIFNDKAEDRARRVVDDSALQKERETADATAALAKAAETRLMKAEQERREMEARQHAEAEQQARDLLENQRLEEERKRQNVGSKAGEQRDFEIAPGVKIAMCWIPPGEFVMGSPAEEAGRGADETQHSVKLTQGFWLAKTETTQGQWQAVMGNNPSSFKGKDLPVETVSWNDIAGPGGFIEKANQGAAGKGRFALPTEAQWEYACQAGTIRPHAGDLVQIAWYYENSRSKTHPVKGKKANGWGLHDMHGNVWEWCSDWYAAYPNGSVTDPQVATSYSHRVIRGGGWSGIANYCRVASRNNFLPTISISDIGFRVARSSAPSPAASGASGTEWPGERRAQAIE
jgi:formylglycine-generating enzyme required for sulfatase activity/serine/threonine protein kinase